MLAGLLRRSLTPASLRSSLALARPAVSTRLRSLASDAVATSAAGDNSVSTETEPATDKSTLNAFTGAPVDMMETRVVKIYQQAQGVQNGTQNMIPWRLQWEDEQTQRWSNPLMGWTGTNDPLSNTHMTLDFGTAEDAMRFCEQNGARLPTLSACSPSTLTVSILSDAGWKYEVIQSKPNKELNASPKKYSDNFKWRGPKGRTFPALYVPPPPPPPKS